MFPVETKILIVDDSDAARIAIANDLRQLGYRNIIQASDGREGLDKISQNFKSDIPIGLIISDWNMPGLNGLEFLKEVRMSQLWEKIPFIMLTTNNDMNEVTSAIAYGVSQYIIKPVQADVLQVKLKDVWMKESERA